MEADHRRVPQPQLMVGAQHTTPIDIDMEGLVQGHPRRKITLVVMDDDVRSVLAERAGKRLQQERATLDDLRAKEDLDVAGFERERDMNAVPLGSWQCPR